MNIIPFEFDTHQIRVQVTAGQPWFNAGDVCDVLSYGNARQAIETHVEDDDVQKLDAIDSMGRVQMTNHINESGLYALILGSTKPEAKRFKKWVTSEVLPSIRKTGGYQIGGEPVKQATEALKIAPLAVRAARALGLDKNAAAISANQFVRKLTGMNLLEGFGATHLVAENQETLYFTPTELGKMMGGLSAQKVNLLLAGAGLQARVGEHWKPLDAGKDFARLLDTGKKHSDGVPVQQVKWSDTVLPLLKQEEVA